MMTVPPHVTANRYLDRPAPSALADVVDVILDKGLVIDAYVRVSLVGIELLTIDARIVVASVDTYLRFAQAVNRMDLTETETHGIPELMQDMTQSGAKGKAKGALDAAEEKFEQAFGRKHDEEEESEEEGEKRPATRRPSRRRSSSDEG
jgi:gas vesicle structural protein